MYFVRSLYINSLSGHIESPKSRQNFNILKRPKTMQKTTSLHFRFRVQGQGLGFRVRVERVRMYPNLASDKKSSRKKSRYSRTKLQYEKKSCVCTQNAPSVSLDPLRLKNDLFFWCMQAKRIITIHLISEPHINIFRSRPVCSRGQGHLKNSYIFSTRQRLISHIAKIVNVFIFEV